MGEIYRDTVNAGLTFDVPGATVTSVEFRRNNELVKAGVPGTTVAVPYAITNRSGSFTVLWKYDLQGESYERRDAHDVVTPVFTKAQLTAWDNDFSDLSDDKVKYLEMLVRQIIQTYCNQKFELEEGATRLVPVAGGGYRSKERIVHIDGAHYTLGHDNHTVYNLDTYTSMGYNIKIPIEAEAYENGWHPAALNRVQTVKGTFGWVSVPEEVKTAALYLAESFSCDESMWRERYISSVRAADWRFDYNAETFYSTGSLLADQLLTPFIRMEYAIV